MRDKASGEFVYQIKSSPSYTEKKLDTAMKIGMESSDVHLISRDMVDILMPFSTVEFIHFILQCKIFIFSLYYGDISDLLLLAHILRRGRSLVDIQ